MTKICDEYNFSSKRLEMAFVGVYLAHEQGERARPDVEKAAEARVHSVLAMLARSWRIPLKIRTVRLDRDSQDRFRKTRATDYREPIKDLQKLKPSVKDRPPRCGGCNRFSQQDITPSSKQAIRLVHNLFLVCKCASTGQL